jgi:hypothetical protein
MDEQNQPINSLQEIHDIRRMMERSSRFISLSGLSGVVAGICALVAAYIAQGWISTYYEKYNGHGFESHEFEVLKWRLFVLAAVVIGIALVGSFYFTGRRAKRTGVPLWGHTSRKLIWNMLVPLASGGLFILSMLQYSEWHFIAPACLIFYGLALVNASKYTINDIRYLGYLEIVLGLINTQYLGYGLYCWAIGFGILHIVYGVIMWWKYERK